MRINHINEIKEPVQAWMTPREDVLSIPRMRTDRPTPYNTELRFDREDLTRAGGYPQFAWFCDRFGLPQILERVRIKKRRSEYSALDLNLFMIDMIVLGIERISHLDTWGSDALLPLIRGHEKLPHSTTIFRHMESFTERNIMELERVQSEALRKGLPPAENAVLDLDSTVITVYGNKEGSEIGYNPHKKGRPSYNLKAGFIGGREMVYFRLDPGNTVSSTGFAEFLDKCLSALPEHVEVSTLRLDGGYYSNRNLSLLEEKGLSYVVKVPSYPNLIREAMGLAPSAWREVTDEGEFCLPLRTWVSEMRYNGRRLLIKRVLVEEEKEKDNGLFEPGERYEFSFYITNMEGDPWEIIGFYNARATVENRIKEAKLGFRLDKLPSGLFRVNVIYLHFVMLAYNLLWWFKDSLLLGKKLSDRGIRFLREVLFLVPAVVERCGEMFILHLPSAWPFAGLMNEIMVSLARPAPA